MKIDIKKLPIKYRPTPSGEVGVWIYYLHIANITYSEITKTYFTRFLSTGLSIEEKDKKSTDDMIRAEVEQFLMFCLVDDNKQPIITV
jgi:hypothetical protein